MPLKGGLTSSRCYHSECPWPPGCSPGSLQRHCPHFKAEACESSPTWTIGWYAHGQEWDALSNLALLIEHVTRLGFTVNYAKSSLTPSQRAVFIGIQLESQLMRAAPSSPRVDDIVQLVQQFRRGHTRPFRSFQTLLGMLTGGFGGSPLGPPHITTPPDLDEEPWVASATPQAQIGHSHCRVHEMPTSLEEACTPNPGGPYGVHTLSQRGSDDRRVLSRLGAVWQCRAAQGIDIFASQATTHCPLWFSLGESTSPLGQDALGPRVATAAPLRLPTAPTYTTHRGQDRQGHHRVLLVAPDGRGECGSPYSSDY